MYAFSSVVESTYRLMEIIGFVTDMTMSRGNQYYKDS